MLRKLDADDPFMERYTKFFFLDHRATALHGRAAERSDMDAELFAEMEACRQLMAKGKVAQNIYYGSQWWALTRETCEHLLNVIGDNGHLFQSFKFTAIPDEMFIQTIVGNDVKHSKFRNGPVFVDWSRQPKPFVFGGMDQIPPDTVSQYAFYQKTHSRSHDFLGRFRDSLLKDIAAISLLELDGFGRAKPSGATQFALEMWIDRAVADGSDCRQDEAPLV